MAYVADATVHLRLKFTGGDDCSAFALRIREICCERNLVYNVSTAGNEWVSITIRPRNSRVSADEVCRIAEAFEQIATFAKEQVSVSG